MTFKKKKRIRKVTQITALNDGTIINSIDSDSITDAPSIHTVNENFLNKKNGGTLESDIIFNNSKFIKGTTVKDKRNLSILGIYSDDTILIGSPFLKAKIRSKEVPVWDDENHNTKKFLVEGDAAVGDSFPVGTIIDYQGDIADIPTGYEVYDYVPRKQLLINNDFQCNQRGQDNYTSTDNTIYTVDMWRINKLSLTVESDGITITNTDTKTHGFVQILNNPLTNGKYTATVKIVSITGDVLLYGIKKLESGINIFTFDSAIVSKDRFNIDLQPNSSIKINCCDLFEGSIAYQHARENYSVALDRCMDYLQIYEVVNLGLFKAWGESRNSLLIGYIGMYKKMISKPTITFNYTKVYSDSNVNGYDYEKDILNVITTISNNDIKIMIKKLNSLDTFNRDYEYFINTEKVILSCEPL